MNLSNQANIRTQAIWMQEYLNPAKVCMLEKLTLGERINIASSYGASVSVLKRLVELVRLFPDKSFRPSVKQPLVARL